MPPHSDLLLCFLIRVQTVCERGLSLGSVVSAWEGTVCGLRCTLPTEPLGQHSSTSSSLRFLTGVRPLLLFAKFMQMEWSQSETECPIMGDLSLTSLTCVGGSRCCAVLVLPAACIMPPHGTLASSAADAALPRVTAGWQLVSCARKCFRYTVAGHAALGSPTSTCHLFVSEHRPESSPPAPFCSIPQSHRCGQPLRARAN